MKITTITKHPLQIAISEIVSLALASFCLFLSTKGSVSYESTLVILTVLVFYFLMGKYVFIEKWGVKNPLFLSNLTIGICLAAGVISMYFQLPTMAKVFSILNFVFLVVFAIKNQIPANQKKIYSAVVLKHFLVLLILIGMGNLAFSVAT